MKNYVSLIAENIGRLLMLPNYISSCHCALAYNMKKTLNSPEKLNKETLRGLLTQSYGLLCCENTGKKAIMMIREDLKYLIALKE